MFKLAPPRGFINWKKNLYIKPDVITPQVGAPCSILFISDIHLREAHPELIDRLKEAFTGLSPEIVLIGGDVAEYAGGFEKAISVIRESFPNSFMAAVPGNNDEGDRGEQKAILSKYGCNYLLNECVKYKNVEIVGVEDSYTHNPSCKGLFSRDEGVYRILMSHEPHSFLLDEADVKPDLMLSGHTHGGQINVLGFTCYLLGYENHYDFTHIAGIKHIGKTVCIVSRGIGISKYPLRIGARPEIYYLTGSEQI